MRTNGSVCQVGLDCHRTFSKATARDEDGQVVWRRRLEHRDRATLKDELSSWPEGMAVILESTFGWGWMSDELLEAGLEPHLANSRKVAAWRDARGLAKSDRIDADLLSELWLQRPRWWEVWLAPPEVRERREWMRYRMTLVAMQTGLKNRIHALLHRHGIVNEHSDLFGAQGRRMLNSLVAPAEDDVTLPESARATLKGYLQLLDHVRRQIARVTREYRKQLTLSSAARRLMTLPGIGQILAYTIMAEIGQIERFRSSKHLASYSLLVPRATDSGEPFDPDNPKGRHIGHMGRRTLKWAWIEAAHGAVRSGGRFRAIFDRVTDGGKKNRNRGYIVVANELCRIGHVLIEKDTDYCADRPARPGSRVAKHDSRPGMGQPEDPMVAAAV
ncbi:MAG: IS110 family transposase [Phycisphaerae bacterium]|nr:IS110 family transposase [Phycisphaerae bacterium]